MKKILLILLSVFNLGFAKTFTATKSKESFSDKVMKKAEAADQTDSISGQDCYTNGGGGGGR